MMSQDSSSGGQVPMSINCHFHPYSLHNPSLILYLGVPNWLDIAVLRKKLDSLFYLVHLHGFLLQPWWMVVLVSDCKTQGIWFLDLLWRQSSWKHHAWATLVVFMWWVHLLCDTEVKWFSIHCSVYISVMDTHLGYCFAGTTNFCLIDTEHLCIPSFIHQT